MEEQSNKNAEVLGLQTLLFQTMEECGELIKAISKYNRVHGIGQKTEANIEDVYIDLLSEIADVEICIEQLTYLLEEKDLIKKLKQKAYDKVSKRYGIK